MFDMFIGTSAGSLNAACLHMATFLQKKLKLIGQKNILIK